MVKLPGVTNQVSNIMVSAQVQEAILVDGLYLAL